MAIADSVTVSIAADTSGIFRVISRVIFEDTSVSFGCTSECPGIRSTSSKVRASLTIFEARWDWSVIGLHNLWKRRTPGSAPTAMASRARTGVRANRDLWRYHGGGYPEPPEASTGWV